MIVEIPRWSNAKLVRFPKLAIAHALRADISCAGSVGDLQGRGLQPYSPGHQEGQAPLCAQLLPSQG